MSASALFILKHYKGKTTSTAANMSRILLGVFSVALCFTLGYTLKCYECKMGLWSLCFTTEEMCPSNQHCFYGEGKAGGIVKLKMKGCLELDKCNKTTEVNFPSGTNTSVYKMAKYCCNSDLCNTAAPLANTHTLTLAIGSLVTLLLTKALM